MSGKTLEFLSCIETFILLDWDADLLSPWTKTSPLGFFYVWIFFKGMVADCGSPRSCLPAKLWIIRIWNVLHLNVWHEDRILNNANQSLMCIISDEYVTLDKWKEENVQGGFHVTAVNGHQVEQTVRLWSNNFNFSLPSATALIALQFSKHSYKETSLQRDKFTASQLNTTSSLMTSQSNQGFTWFSLDQ